ncbi:MAG: GNAT family N-acetyltransferase [Bacteroidota bacterium]|nr:GNAT family N-acetyltransferase [Bacteroidota bacterium]
MKIIPYHKKYKREHFSCGKPSLDNYILRNVTGDVISGACTCFVIIDESELVISYYTLSAANIPIDDAPVELKKKIQYAHIPIILLSRLAVDVTHRGKGFGKLLVVDALLRCWQVSKTQVGSVAVIVDPIDEEAEKFYTKFGFTKLPDSGRMFMTIKKIEAAFSG